MSDPLSLSRVKAALKRAQPPRFYSSDDTSGVVKELGVIARPLGFASDLFEQLLPSLLLLPGFVGLLDRWERTLRLPTRPNESTSVRIGRVQSVISRRRGYTKAKLAASLGPAMGIDPTQVGWAERTRTPLDAAMRYQRTWGGNGFPLLIGATGNPFLINTPWPATVDDTGITVTLHINVAAASDVTEISLGHADGTKWVMWNGVGAQGANIDFTARNRTAFLGKRAGAQWTLLIKDPVGASGAAYLTQVAVTISNDSTARQIYYCYAIRDPAFGVTTSLADAQRLLDRAGIAHMYGVAAERSLFQVDDNHSLTDREAVGS